MSASLRGGDPDADILAELTGAAPMKKLPQGDPVLGLVAPPAPRAARPAPVVPAAAPEPEVAAEPAEELKEKIGGWYGLPSNLRRIRAAQHYTQTQADGWPSLSEMTEAVLLAEAERLEQVHNGGEPFPEVPAGRVKRSRKPTS